MSPTVFRAKGYRFYFFSREEPRMHVHVQSGKGEAKYWLVPTVELAVNHGLPTSELAAIRRLIEERLNEIKQAWQQHFPS